MRDRRAEQALSDATRALELEPRHFSALLVRGGALRELHDFAGAKAAYEELLEAHPWSSAATELFAIEQATVCNCMKPSATVCNRL